MNGYHIPVLLHIAVDYLINSAFEEHIIVDGTAGGGGYSELICEKTSDNSRIICIDRDAAAIEYITQRLIKFGKKVILQQGNFADIDKILYKMSIESITGCVLDLGLSQYQIEAKAGFSYQKDSPLDMRTDENIKMTAEKVVNEYSREKLIEIFKNYGEIANAERLVNAIIRERKKNKIDTTQKLVKAIENEYSLSKPKMVKFLSKIFQAIRIEVNSELDNLSRFLSVIEKLLLPGGRLVIVSYHSLEDRLVKNFFKSRGINQKQYEKGNKGKAGFLVLTKHPIVPDKREIAQNRKSRSAKLRAAEKI
ncbi:MAG: 16S rRNA (cytosine(1402)-N(4))-methyltransferase RsmH [Ignavibacteria bacterium]